MRTVFILGAGASRAMTEHLPVAMPLANEFFRPEYVEIANMMTSDGDWRESDLFAFVEKFYRVKVIAPCGGDDTVQLNIEELASIIDSLANDQPHQMALSFQAHEIHRQLMNYIVSIVQDLSERYKQQLLLTLPPCQFWRHVAAIMNQGELGPGFATINFNWDSIVENTMRHVRDELVHLNTLLKMADPINNAPNTLPSVERIQLPYYKIHGWVEWVRCADRNCLGFRLLRAPAVVGNPGCCPYCGLSQEWHIVNPVAYKKYDSHPMDRLQFTGSCNALQLAERIVLFGYSASVNDFRANLMFRLSRFGNLDRDFKERKVELIVIDKYSADQISKRVASLIGEPISIKAFESLAAYADAMKLE